MFEIQSNKGHRLFAVRAFWRVISEGEADDIPGKMHSPATSGRGIDAVPGIKPIVTGHLEVPFREMLYQELYKVDGRDNLLDKDIVFVPVVMESDVLTVIGVNTGKCNDRVSQVTADMFNYSICIGKGRFCIDMKAVLVFAVDKCFGLFKGGSNPFLHFIKEDGLESLAQVRIIEMSYRVLESFVREDSLCNKAMDIGGPF